MKKQKAHDKRLAVAFEMPPLQRTHAGELYKHENDAVLKWIAKKPELMMYMFDLLSRLGYIAYDSATRTWSGTGRRER